MNDRERIEEEVRRAVEKFDKVNASVIAQTATAVVLSFPLDTIHRASLPEPRLKMAKPWVDRIDAEDKARGI